MSATPDPNKPVVTRFAPSPTGNLHVGGARTALYAWAVAQQAKRRVGPYAGTESTGSFILRFEDTDRARSSAASEKQIAESLLWLGLDWDEGPAIEGVPGHEAASGDRGPYRQSERLAIYHDHLARLREAGHVIDDDGAVRFRVTQDVTFTDAVYGEVTVKADDIEDFVIMKRKVEGDDLAFPTFHFAVVVDDALMDVTHVIRGVEHLSNTPKHAALYDALGYPRPLWCHTPSIMNPDGSKMSKRDKAKAARKAAGASPLSVEELTRKAVAKQSIAGAHNGRELVLRATAATPSDDQLELTVFSDAHAAAEAAASPTRALMPFFEEFVTGDNDNMVVAEWILRSLGYSIPEIDTLDFRRSGYLPSPLLNYLSLLGWNPGDDLERFDVDTLTETFDLTRVNKANSKFDRDKLLEFNRDTIAHLSIADFAAELNRVRPSLQLTDQQWTWLAQAFHERARTLREPFAAGAFVWAFDATTSEATYEPKAVKKWLMKNDAQGLADLEKARAALDAVGDDFTPEAIEAALESCVAEHGMKNLGAVAQPLRVAVSGTAVTPPIHLTLALIGKAETRRRIDACLAVFKDAAKAKG